MSTPTAAPPASVRDSFTAAMAQVAAPVSVVTTTVDGRPVGTTVSAFVSLSMAPPMLLVSLQDTSFLLSQLRVGSPFGVNILAHHQSQLAAHFATRAVDRFDGVTWELRHGVPALPEVHAWVALTVASLVPAGDHVLVLGDVVDAGCGDHAPLTYHRRTYGTHQAH